MSFGAGRKTLEEARNAAEGDPFSQLIDNDFPLRNIFNDQTFQEKFEQQMYELIQTSLDPAHATAVVDYWADQIRSEMPRQIDRWSKYNTEEDRYSVNSPEEWENEVLILKEYLQHRPDAFAKHTDYFNKTN